MATTSNRGWPLPTDNDAADVPADFGTTFEQVDADMQALVDIQGSNEQKITDAQTAAATAVDDVVEIGAITTSFATQVERFVERSTNLFDVYSVTDGVYLPAGTGTPAPNSSYALSDPVQVYPGAEYTYGQFARVTYFDAAGGYVGHDSLPASRVGTYTAPDGAAYVRLSVLKNLKGSAQMNVGSVLLAYESGTPKPIPARYLELPPPSPVELSSNLVNPDQIVYGEVVSRTTGQLSPNSLWNTTDWIAVSGSTPYSVGPSAVEYILAWYDEDRMFLSSTGAPTGTATTSPPTARFLRASIQSTDLDTAQISVGASLPPYEPFWVKVAGINLSGSASGGGGGSRYLLDTTGMGEEYTAPTIPAQPDLDATTTNDVHGWYDALMAAHPDYVTRTDLGVSSDGVTHLYSYTFNPSPVPTKPDGTMSPALTTARPAALFISGVHGFEKSAVWHLWRFAQALCTEWDTSPALDAIRWNVEVVIVPVGNPYSYDQSQPGIVHRTNANGVDVARNFEPLWQAGTPGTSTYGGTAPLSEPENIILDGLMQSVAGRAVVGASLHSFSGSETVNQMIWQAAPTNMMLDLGKRIISRMSRKWRREQTWITDPRTYFGYSDKGAPGGSEGRAMVAHGFPGSTFETARNQLLDGGAGDRHTAEAMTLGYEATVNYLAMAIQAGLERA